MTVFSDNVERANNSNATTTQTTKELKSIYDVTRNDIKDAVMNRRPLRVLEGIVDYDYSALNYTESDDTFTFHRIPNLMLEQTFIEHLNLLSGIIKSENVAQCIYTTVSHIDTNYRYESYAEEIENYSLLVKTLAEVDNENSETYELLAELLTDVSEYITIGYFFGTDSLTYPIRDLVERIYKRTQED